MNKYTWHKIVWAVLYWPISLFIHLKFKFNCDKLDVDGPCIIIPNHVTLLDPLLVTMSFRKKQAYFVASEHLFRLGFISKVLDFLVAPIVRRKGSSAMDTVKSCIKHLKAGRSVILFAEGDTTWDGITGKIPPATGKLVKTSGASLVTYRLEGCYPAYPRWSSIVRRGQMYGRIVRVYSPDELKAKKPDEINALINSDIYENTWERQEKFGTEYKSSKRADGIETVLCLCPKCKKIGSLSARGNDIVCSCGFTATIDEKMFFTQPEPFKNIGEWVHWQDDKLKNGDFEHEEELFSDKAVQLLRLSHDHRGVELENGELRLFNDRLMIGGHCFLRSDIRNLSIVQRNRLLFTCHDEYYELKSGKGVCMRKYPVCVAGLN